MMKQFVFTRREIKLMVFSVVLALAVIFSLGAFSADWPEGKYMAINTDRGILIVDTHNGKYILEQRSFNTVNSLKWMKGDFYTSFKTAKDVGLHHNK